MTCRNPQPWSHQKLVTSIMLKEEKVHSALAEFLLTFKINWLDLVSFFDLVKILHLVLLKYALKKTTFTNRQ